MTCIWNIIIFRVKHWIELGLANVTLKNLWEMPDNIAYNQFPTQNKKLEGDAKWHRIQSVSHTLIFQVFFNITSVLEFVYSHFFTLYLICMWLLFIMPVIKLLFLTIVLPGDFVVARRVFWRETEMAILVARTNLPVWDFQKLASLPSTLDFVTHYRDRHFGNPAGLPTFAYILKSILTLSRYSDSHRLLYQTGPRSHRQPSHGKVRRTSDIQWSIDQHHRERHMLCDTGRD